MLLLVNFSYELGIIIIRYDFLEARWMILSNIRTNFNLSSFPFQSIFCGQMANYKLRSYQAEMPFEPGKSHLGWFK